MGRLEDVLESAKRRTQRRTVLCRVKLMVTDQVQIAVKMYNQIMPVKKGGRVTKEAGSSTVTYLGTSLVRFGK